METLAWRDGDAYRFPKRNRRCDQELHNDLIFAFCVQADVLSGLEAYVKCFGGRNCLPGLCKLLKMSNINQSISNF